jgi:hypothetical protein
MASPKTVYHFTPPQDPHRSGLGHQHASPSSFRHARDPEFSGANPSDTTSPSFDRLMMPTWAEVIQAQEQYETRARHLHRWQRWFVGMFTIYATLAGILVIELVSAQ